jgi:hypothetical protein
MHELKKLQSVEWPVCKPYCLLWVWCLIVLRYHWVLIEAVDDAVHGQCCIWFPCRWFACDMWHVEYFVLYCCLNVCQRAVRPPSDTAFQMNEGQGQRSQRIGLLWFKNASTSCRLILLKSRASSAGSIQQLGDVTYQKMICSAESQMRWLTQRTESWRAIGDDVSCQP